MASSRKLVSVDSPVGSVHHGHERQTTFVYKKLVVPMNMRSVFWKFYGFPANDEGEILTKVKIVCILCKTVIAYNGNTSNLKMHLRSRHPQELDELELNSSPVKKSRVEVKEKKKTKRTKTNDVSYIYSGDSAIQLEKDVHIISDPNISLDELNNSAGTVKVLMKSELEEDNNHNVTAYLMQAAQHQDDNNISELDMTHQSDQNMFDNNNITDAIAQFIVSDLQSPDVVETPGFQRLVATLKSPCEIPSKLKLVDHIIPKLYDTYRDIVVDNLSAARDISLSIEEWVSDYAQVNVTISAHFQLSEQEDQLQSKVLSTVHCSQLYREEHWVSLLEKLFSEWHIENDKLKAIIVATSLQPLLKALGKGSFTLIPCLTYTLQNVCINGCFQLEEVSRVISKVRLLVSLIYRNINALSNLRFHDHISQLEELSLTMDYPKIWISTYIMLDQLLTRRELIGSMIDVVGSTDFEKELINITDEDWSLITDVVNVLEPFKVTTMTFAEEKAPLVSLLKPLLWQLINVHLKIDPKDSPLSTKLKNTMSEALKEVYKDTAVNTILNIAMTLDPRFKALPYSLEECKVALKGPIKQHLLEIIKQYPDKSVGTNGEPQNPAKKARSGMEFLLGNVCSTSHSISQEDRAELELNQYSSEPPANLDHCPLQWWMKSTEKFPHMSKVASKYNCIPATVIPSHRISLESQILYDKKRGKVQPELMDTLIFLNSNHPNYAT